MEDIMENVKDEKMEALENKNQFLYDFETIDSFYLFNTKLEL
jgi:hypothetical protein